jgi:glycogen phosphorylase
MAATHCAEDYIFAGKAAPGYWFAKQIIKLIHNVGRVINNDSRASQWIKVAFIPDYRVSLAEKIIPAADLSEQISTAGTEASGTGNMKLALNGAVTIGTLDGANIEILEEVGEDNMFICGLKVAEVAVMREQKSYRPWEYYARNPHVKRVVDSFSSNLFCPHEPDLFAWISASILDANDEHFHLADLTPYVEAQEKAGKHIPRSGSLDTDGDFERGADGEVFKRSHRRRVRARDLEYRPRVARRGRFLS